MRFYQYTTGRAPGCGYGFFYQNSQLPEAADVPYQMRSLSTLPLDSSVYELHRIDNNHTQLWMTRVMSFGDAKCTYTHVLIAEEATDPVALLKLLASDPSPFFTSQEFNALEQQKFVQENLPMKEIEAPNEPVEADIHLSEAQLNKVLQPMLGYLWQQSFQRSRGQKKLEAAAIVFPAEFTPAQMLVFFANRVLPRLPEGLRDQVSVVCGSPMETAAEFPTTTCCFLTTDTGWNRIPRFDLADGSIYSDDQHTNVISNELGKHLLEKAFPELYWSVLQPMPTRYDLAVPLQHLYMLLNQKTRTTQHLAKFILPRYQELTRLLQASGTDSRSALQNIERAILAYWVEVREENETQANVYEFFVEKALTAPDEALWGEYLEALSKPCKLTDGHQDVHMLLRIHMPAFTSEPPALQDLNRERYAKLLLERMNAQEAPDLAPLILEHLDMQTRHMSGLDEALLAHILKAPTPSDLEFLCNALHGDYTKENIEAILTCAELVRCTPSQSQPLENFLLDMQNGNVQGFSEVMAERLKAKDTDGRLACWLWQKAKPEARAKAGLQAAILEDISSNLSLIKEQWADLLSAPQWTEELIKPIRDRILDDIGQDRDRLIDLEQKLPSSNSKRVVQELLRKLNIDIAGTNPSPENLRWLCGSLQSKYSDQALNAMLECAKKVELTPELAERVAEQLSCIDPAPFENVKERVLALYDQKRFDEPMWTLLKRMRFTYDRAKYPEWKKAEDTHVLGEYQQSLAQLTNAESVSAFVQQWKQLICPSYQRSWDALPSEIPAVQTETANALRKLLTGRSIPALLKLAQLPLEGWFGELLHQAMREHLKARLDNTINDPNNAERLGDLPKLVSTLQMKADEVGSRVRAIALLCNIPTEVAEQKKMLDDLYGEVGGRPDAQIKAFAASQLSKHNREGFSASAILLTLAEYFDKPQDGWQAFFEKRDHLPPQKPAPWKGDIALVNVLHFTCDQLQQTLHVELVWRKALKDYLDGDPLWSTFVKRMEDDRAYRAFVCDPKAKAPRVREWLGLE